MNDGDRGIRRTREILEFENSFLKLFNDEVLFPSGVEGRYVRAAWRSPHSVAVLPVTDDGRFLLLEQFQYATGKWVLQVPKGMGAFDLTPAETARKELMEETGYSCETLVDWGVWLTDPGFMETPLRMFRAEGAKNSGDSQREPTESIRGLHLIEPAQVRDPNWFRQLEDVTTAMMLLRSVAEND